MATLTFPGVYFEEFAPGAPIQGVGTSTAAFLGPAARGEIRLPTKVTSWDQFRAGFGGEPVTGSYLWYAVRGFFENGGTVCYVVRVSDGAYARLTVNNRAGNPMLRVRAQQPGTAPVLQAGTADVHLLSAVPVYQPTGTFTATGKRSLKLTNAAEAARFRPGDVVTLSGANARVQVVGAGGDTLRLADDFAAALNATGTMRLADLIVGTRTVRLAPAAPLATGTLVPGTVLTLTQGTASATAVVEAVQTEQLATNPASTTYRVTFRDGLSAALDMTTPAAAESQEFTLNVQVGSVPSDYPNLSPDPAHPRYYVTVVNTSGGPVVIEPIDPPPVDQLPGALPGAGGLANLTGGQDEHLDVLADPTQHTPHYQAALDTLTRVKDVNLVAAPGVTTAGVQQAIVTHCELLADRFAVLDTRVGADLFGADSLESQRAGLDSARGYAALYGPWLRVPPAGAGPLVLVPPAGHVCGIMARSDDLRGVHKAPANEAVNGAVGLERDVSDTEQGQLNLQGVNLIRVFKPGGRPVLWGTRTTSPDTTWQYVNIRRLFLFLEGSIEAGIRWAVFEPNNLQLWQKLRRTLTDFLTRVWKDGALFGAKREEAFYVRIDEALNPFSEQQLGRLYVEIGVRPAYPAEFIVVRIGIWDGGSEVSEG